MISFVPWMEATREFSVGEASVRTLRIDHLEKNEDPLYLSLLQCRRGSSAFLNRGRFGSKFFRIEN